MRRSELFDRLLSFSFSLILFAPLAQRASNCCVCFLLATHFRLQQAQPPNETSQQSPADADAAVGELILMLESRAPNSGCLLADVAVAGSLLLPLLLRPPQNRTNLSGYLKSRANSEILRLQLPQPQHKASLLLLVLLALHLQQQHLANSLRSTFVCAFVRVAALPRPPLESLPEARRSNSKTTTKKMTKMTMSLMMRRTSNWRRRMRWKDLRWLQWLWCCWRWL